MNATTSTLRYRATHRLSTIRLVVTRCISGPCAYAAEIACAVLVSDLRGSRSLFFTLNKV